MVGRSPLQLLNCGVFLVLQLTSYANLDLVLGCVPRNPASTASQLAEHLSSISVSSNSHEAKQY